MSTARSGFKGISRQRKIILVAFAIVVLALVVILVSSLVAPPGLLRSLFGALVFGLATPSSPLSR